MHIIRKNDIIILYELHLYERNETTENKINSFVEVLQPIQST